MNNTTNGNCDQSLLTLLISEDAQMRQQGWQAWYERDHAALYAAVSRRCWDMGNMAQCDDIVHDTFIIAFKKMEEKEFTYQGKSLCAYLHGISKNLIYDLYRRRKRVAFQELDVETPQENLVGLADQVHLRDILLRVREAYQQLAANQYNIVVGLYILGKTSVELSRELEKSAVNVRAIALRAINAMRAYLANRHQIDLSANALRLCLQHL